MDTFYDNGGIVDAITVSYKNYTDLIATLKIMNQKIDRLETIANMEIDEVSELLESGMEIMRSK